MNDTNIDFYRHIKIDKFKELAKLTGFDTCPDIELIHPYLQNAKVLLELGAGYGRAIHALLDRNFKGNIIAIDRVPELIGYLQDRVPASVTLLQQDLRNFSIPQTPEVVLWLWSGILELSKDEQQASIRHIAGQLPKDGLLIVEIPRKVKYVGVHIGDQRIWVETDWGTLEGYLPRHDEMEHFSKEAGFSSLETINYHSETGLERAIYVMKK